MYDWDQAEKMLMSLWKSNKDTKKFFDGVCKGKLGQFIDALDDIVYRPFTIDELTTTVTENWDDYEKVSGFFLMGKRSAEEKIQEERKSIKEKFGVNMSCRIVFWLCDQNILSDIK